MQRQRGTEPLEGGEVGLKREELAFGADQAEAAEGAAAAAAQDEGEEVAPVPPGWREPCRPATRSNGGLMERRSAAIVDRAANEPMTRSHVVTLMAYALVARSTPAFADNQMKQSPLLMRRAGPSCQPGNLGSQPGAGYSYRLGPCAGVDTSAAPDLEEDRALPGRRRRF